MKLRLETEGHSPYWLVGSPNVDVRTFAEAMEASLQISRNQQAVPGAGYYTQEFHDRGNQRVTFEATTSRTFSTAIERMRFLATLAPDDPARLAHQWQGTVWVREEVGAAWSEWPLHGAVVALAGVTPEGAISVKLRYRVQAPGFGAEVSGLAMVRTLAGYLGAVPEDSFNTAEAEEEIEFFSTDGYSVNVEVAVAQRAAHPNAEPGAAAEFEYFYFSKHYWVDPEAGPPEYDTWPPDWEALAAEIEAADARVEAWVESGVLHVRGPLSGRWGDNNFVDVWINAWSGDVESSFGVYHYRNAIDIGTGFGGPFGVGGIGLLTPLSTDTDALIEGDIGS